MKIIADLHVHSKFSRATSPLMEVESMDPWARKKGIQVLGTGDFTHPEYFKLLKSKLKEGPDGLYLLKKGGCGTHFMLTSEISSIYSQGGKTRRVHTLIFAPDLASVEKINKELASRGNIASDGRPILGLPVKELVKIVLGIDDRCFLVPAHAWTPWFAVFGSKSGFDSLEECFEEEAKHIYAIETGLSSDMTMNRRLSALDHVALISNSDSHSPSRLGREANVLDCKLSYEGIVRAIKSNDRKQFLCTIEYYPDEGRYHYDGHKDCGVSLHPRESKEKQNRCPRCYKPLTLGVLHRVEELADRPWDFSDERFVPQKHSVQLIEIIAEALGTGPTSVKAGRCYEEILSHGISELDLLLEMSLEQAAKAVPPKVLEGIRRVREGNIDIIPGFDGEYGKVLIFEESKRSAGLSSKKKKNAGQIELF